MSVLKKIILCFWAVPFFTGVIFANPVFDGADPHALSIAREYWIFPTESHASEPLFAAYRSRNLRDWKREGVILKLRDVAWIKDDGARNHHAWAPALAAKGGKFYLYFSVGPQNPTPSRIGVAVSDKPEGPFVDSGKPLLTGGKGFEAIDPMVFYDAKTKQFFLYAGGSAGAKLRVFIMAPDMVNLSEEVKVETPPSFTEGAFMHFRNGTYYLSYSSGRWSDASYSVHYATAKSPTGPWKYRGKILESDATHQGPGHHSFVENPSTGDWFIVYHRWETTEKSNIRGSRKIAIEKIRYDTDGAIRAIKMTDAPPPEALITGKMTIFPM